MYELTLNVEEVINYILRYEVARYDGLTTDGYRIYPGKIRERLHNVLLTEAKRRELGIVLLDEEGVNEMWNEGYVPRVVVEYVFGLYKFDYRELTENVVTHMW